MGLSREIFEVYIYCFQAGTTWATITRCISARRLLRGFSSSPPFSPSSSSSTTRTFPPDLPFKAFVSVVFFIYYPFLKIRPLNPYFVSSSSSTSKKYPPEAVFTISESPLSSRTRAGNAPQSSGKKLLFSCKTYIFQEKVNFWRKK